MTSFQIAAVYIAVNLLLLVWLALRVVTYRRQSKVSLGDGGHEALTLAIRVHGNASEYIPAAMAGMLAMAALSTGPWAMHIVGLGFTIGRLLHATGLGRGILPFRQIGIVLTWVGLVAMAAILVWEAFGTVG